MFTVEARAPLRASYLRVRVRRWRSSVLAALDLHADHGSSSANPIIWAAICFVFGVPNLEFDSNKLSKQPSSRCLFSVGFLKAVVLIWILFGCTSPTSVELRIQLLVGKGWKQQQKKKIGSPGNSRTNYHRNFLT